MIDHSKIFTQIIKGIGSKISENIRNYEIRGFLSYEDGITEVEVYASPDYLSPSIPHKATLSYEIVESFGSIAEYELISFEPIT